MRASKEFIDKYYTDYLAERNSIEGRWARQYLKDVLGRCVLNVGCGPQLYDEAAEFPLTLAELVGIDLNESNIEFLATSIHPRLLRSKKILQDNGTRIECFLHDVKVKRLDFINRFDAIYAGGFLGMFNRADTAHIVELLFKYLTPNGRFVMVTWDDDRLTAKEIEERGRYSWYWRNGSGFEEIEYLLKRVGFVILKKGIHNVANPVEYEWGVIYSFVAQK